MDTLLSFFITDAWAAEGGEGTNPMGSLIMLGMLFVLFYFFLIRPQSKKAKEHRAMVEALAKGDEVATSGGILGRITQISDQIVTMEIANNVEVKVQRQSIQTVMPKGTIKSS